MQLQQLKTKFCILLKLTTKSKILILILNCVECVNFSFVLLELYFDYVFD
jgi:hypothetical protein